MIEIKIPELAESITEGTIANWLVKEGDAVKQGDAVAELETDKVNVEVITESDGVVAEILKQPGETARVGEVIVRLNENELKEVAEAKDDTSQSEPQQAHHAETPREEVPLNARPEPLQPATGPRQAGSQPPETDARPIASPALRRFAHQKGVDLNQITTDDPMGYITARDIEAFASGQVPNSHHAAPASQPGAQTAQPKESSTPTDDQPFERIRMSRRRQTIANHLVETQHTAAMLTTYNELDMSAILDVRKRRKEAFKEKNEVSLGLMSFFTRAVVGALKAFPRLNAEIQGEEMLLKKYYNIGIAVAAEEGLVVPVVRHADRLNFAEIERHIATLANKARNKKLELKDLQDGTFTITNGGIFGSLWSTPILNGPQVGILGMHGIKNRPVEVDGEMQLRPMMYIALSYDHRIVDGSEAVRFLVAVKEMLEDPETLLLEG